MHVHIYIYILYIYTHSYLAKTKHAKEDTIIKEKTYKRVLGVPSVQQAFFCSELTGVAAHIQVQYAFMANSSLYTYYHIRSSQTPV